jgi:hypothetical protein
MAAPTWPKDPDNPYVDGVEPDSDEVDQQLTDQEAEEAILASFLFSPPVRQLVAGIDNGTPLSQVQRRVAAWLSMVTGRHLASGYSDPSSTDGENLFLPPAVAAPAEEKEDERLYRVMGIVQIGLVELGFLSNKGILSDIHKDWVLRSTYHILAARAVLNYYRRELPGLAKDIDAVSRMEKAGALRVNITPVPKLGLPEAFLPLYRGLTGDESWGEAGFSAAKAREAVEAVDREENLVALRLLVSGQAVVLREHFLSLRLGPPPLPWYLGIVRPEWFLAKMGYDGDADEDWKKGQLPLRQLIQARARLGLSKKGDPVQATGSLRSRLKSKLKRKLESPDSAASVSNQPAYGVARDDAQAEAQKAHKPKFSEGLDHSIFTGDSATKPDDEGHIHDEWDFRLRNYRLAATRVISPEAQGGSIDGYNKIVKTHKAEIAKICRQFEALRIEERWRGGEREGPELDLPRVVRAITDIQAGYQPDDNLYRRFIRDPQDVTVMTLVDLSGSTQGRILSEEQRAVVLFAEGLQRLSVPHAFYGFNGTAPTSCTLHRLKGFKEQYEEGVYKRLGNLRASGGTRLGAHIREAHRILSVRSESRRILILLSDGKPEARGDYRGEYGIEDSAMAVKEGAKHGIKTHCVSLDFASDAPDYLAKIFGRGNFLVLERAESLALRLPELFRGLIH